MPIEVTEDQTSLGRSLGPVLREACRGRLGDINWFRATWQHGGAATGFSTWDAGGGRLIDCVVKLPVGYREYFWTKRLGLTSVRNWDRSEKMVLSTPRVLAGGFELGGYDFAWLVMEKLAGPPLASKPTSQSVWEVFETAAEFHAAAVTERSVETDKLPKDLEWARLIEKGLGVVRDNDLPGGDRWVRALEQTQLRLDSLEGYWAGRDVNSWCHHDLHGRNVMRRVSDDPDHPGHAVLIDLAMVRAGHWVEDALYMERLYWGHEGHLCRIDPVEALAKARAYAGLPVGDDFQDLVGVRRVLMAATVPAFIRTEGEYRYLEAALEHLERHLAALVG